MPDGAELEWIRNRVNLPTAKNSREIARDIDPRILARSFISARVCPITCFSQSLPVPSPGPFPLDPRRLSVREDQPRQSACGYAGLCQETWKR